MGRIEIDIPSRMEFVTVVRMIAAAAAESVGALVGDRLDDLKWVMSEATTNAMQANLSSEVPGRVTAVLELGTGWVRIRVTDEGPGMPDAPAVPDIDHPDRLHIEGGFGIPLMQHLSSTELQFLTGPAGTTVELELHQ